MTDTLIHALSLRRRQCAAKLCGRLIDRLDEYWIDKLAGDAEYCKKCGIMLRYHRKKAGERGEAPPVTFEQVDERLARR